MTSGDRVSPLFDHCGDVGLQGIQEIVLFTVHQIDGLNGHFLQELLVDCPGVAGVTCGLKPRAAPPDNGLAAPVVPMDAPVKFAAVSAENHLCKTVIAGKTALLAWRADVDYPATDKLRLHLHKEFFRNDRFVVALDVVLRNAAICSMFSNRYASLCTTLLLSDRCSGTL